jgi:hypothetical protein
VKDKYIRECDKDDDGLQVTFLGIPQKKKKSIVGDDYRPIPESLLVDPSKYSPGLFRLVMTVLAIIQKVLIWAVGITFSIAMMVFLFWILKLMGNFSAWLLSFM